MDGATVLGDNLMPGPSDAAWIAQFGARRLMAHLGDGAPPRAALKKALGDTQKSFAALQRRPPQAKWQIPCASMMLVTEAQARLPSARVRAPEGAGRAPAPVASEGRRGLDFMWLGDCAALLGHDGRVEMIGHLLPARSAEAARARTVTKDMPAAIDLNRPQVLEHLRAGRARVGSGDYWLFAPDPAVAPHAARRRAKAEAGDHLLLASDGFLALISDYDAYDADGLLAAALDRGLAVLAAELRAIEQADAKGERFARFKSSDDATALLLRVS
jgi:serine/threonine protein phosphatase PrpC